MVNGVPQFGTPVLHNWNWRALSSTADILAFGPQYKDYRKAVCLNDDVDNIKAFDRVWLDSTPSDPTDVLAKDAEFYILSADKGAGGYADVAFKRLGTDG